MVYVSDETGAIVSISSIYVSDENGNLTQIDSAYADELISKVYQQKK